MYCGLLSDLSSDAVKQEALEKLLEFREIEAKSKKKTLRKFIPLIKKEMNEDADNIMALPKWDVVDEVGSSYGICSSLQLFDPIALR